MRYRERQTSRTFFSFCQLRTGIEGGECRKHTEWVYRSMRSLKSNHGSRATSCSGLRSRASWSWVRATIEAASRGGTRRRLLVNGPALAVTTCECWKPADPKAGGLRLRDG